MLFKSSSFVSLTMILVVPWCEARSEACEPGHPSWCLGAPLLRWAVEAAQLVRKQGFLAKEGPDHLYLCMQIEHPSTK